MDEYDDYYNDYDSEDAGEADFLDEISQVREDASISEMYQECVEPAVFSASDQLGLLFISCLLFRIITQLFPVPKTLCHITSFFCGLVGLFSIIGSSAAYTAILGISTYWCAIFCVKKPLAEYSYRVTVGLLLVYLVIREYFEILPESWEQIRGIQMIIVLKSLSVCYELTGNREKNLPPLLEYVGYIFCPATVVFGPWIPFSMYIRVFERRKWTFGWVVKVFATSTFAFLCLGISSCWVYWLFLGITSSWIVAVRDALSVRFSHYFIALMSEATSVLSGFYSDDGLMSVEVTKPWRIEVPRSLVEVVVHWNMPMHKWLKIHIFRPAAHLNAFLAVFLTFLVSSLLHGMNFGLTMVLLSLGLYTYVEYTLREKLASIFDACIRSRVCPSDCEHHHKSSHWIVFFVNIVFSLWAYFHLAYLGIMMDKSHQESEVQSQEGLMERISKDLHKWQNLNYASHWAVFAAYLGSIVI